MSNIELKTEKTCNNCKYYPCLKTQCRLGQIGCEDHISITEEAIKNIGKSNGK